MAILSSVVMSAPAQASSIVYDDFSKPGYSLADYAAKWSNPYGLGEMALGDTRNFAGGRFNISAAPFQTAYDFSVYDHLKYMAASNQSFAVPKLGSLTIGSTIQAQTPGAQDGRVINGTYIQSGLPYAQATLEAQQAAAVMNMIDFKTGQLFDWFIAGDQAFTLIERLPSSVVNPGLNPGDAGYVGIDKMYTQIIDVMTVGAGPHDVSITYNHLLGGSSVDFYIDGALASHVDNIGIPLDQQGHPFTGIYPSYGPGELLFNDIDSFTIGHGLFSLLDAFPFQHPDRPDLAVSIPVQNRIFGQGVIASFDNFTVASLAVPEPATWGLMILGFGVVGAAARRRPATARA